MKKILIGISVVIVLGVVVFIAFRKKENGLNFRTEKISKGDIVETVTASGNVNAVTTVLVGTQVSGTIKSIYADFNSPVKKGQLIAQIDPAIFEAQVEQARANLLSAKANLEKAEASFIDAKRTMERNKVLFSKDLIARSEVDTAETNYETSKAQVNASKAQIAQSEASLKAAETNLRYTRIISPVNGIVVSRNVDVGQTVAASFQTPTLFTIAQDLTKMQIDTNVAEADIGRVRQGQDVEFNVDAYLGIIFKGRVSQVRNAPITVQNVVTYDVVIAIDNREGLLRPDMTTNTTITVAKREQVLAIPNQAVRREDGDRVVFVQEGDRLVRRPVKTGWKDKTYTEVLSGLKDGDRVVTAGAFLLDAETRLNPAASAAYFGASGQDTGKK